MELRIIAARAGRLSSFITGELRLSTGLMNRRKRDESIRVNGIHRWMDYAVQPGDVITVQLDEPDPDYPAEEGPLDILYEDDFLLAVDKPQGMLIHPSRSRNTGTLANFVWSYYRKTGQRCAFHPLTRLDRDTFGLVLLAKNAHIHSLLQSEAHEKIYHAVTLGSPRENSGIIDAPIARCPLPSLLRQISPEGKPSVTQYRVLERREDLCKLELCPVTGRTHQLRLHCAYRGFPILGDPQYGSEASVRRSEQLGLTGQQLCAESLRLHHPITGEMLLLESKMDVTFPQD